MRSLEVSYIRRKKAMNYKIVMEYEGTRYKGWQKQKNTEDTIQGILENAIENITGEKTDVNGSGRTDAGVHARGQTANFKVKGEYENIMESINDILPKDIRILSCKKADDRFHARLNAKAKTYEYKIDTARKAGVFARRTVNHLCCELDMDKMREAKEKLVGEKDFMAFSSNRRTKKSTVRTIYSIDIIREGSIVTFRYRGNGFLYNMVRILTGTLIEVGMGKIDADDIEDIILSRDRGRAGMTMPPKGLTLVSVEY